MHGPTPLCKDGVCGALTLERATPADGAGDMRQCVERRLAESAGNVAGDAGLRAHWLAITKPIGQPGQHALRAEIEQRRKRRANHVGLGVAVVLDIARCKGLVETKVTGCSGRLDAETRRQIVAPQFPDKPQLQLDVGQPVALCLGKLMELGDGRFGYAHVLGHIDG